MITCKINVSKIDKTELFEGKSGKYLDLALLSNKDGPDKYGNDGFVVQSISKERREAGERGPIIGNWKCIEAKTKDAPTEPTTREDDMPF